jgi:hypothetical protein
MRRYSMARRLLLAVAAVLAFARPEPAAARDWVAVYGDFPNVARPMIAVVRTACISSQPTAYFQGKPINFGHWQGHQVNGNAVGFQTPTDCIDNTTTGKIVSTISGGHADSNFWQALVVFQMPDGLYAGVWPLPEWGGVPLDPKMEPWGFFPAGLVNAINVTSKAGFWGHCGAFDYCFVFNQGMNYAFAAPMFKIPGATTAVDAIKMIPNGLLKYIPDELLREAALAAADPNH